MIARLRHGVWWTVPVLLLGWIMSLGCATSEFLNSRERGTAAWNPSQEIATGNSQAYITGVAPLPGGGRRYELLLRGLLLGRPADRGFVFTVDELPGKMSEVTLAEVAEPAVTPTRGQPLQIWHPGSSTNMAQLTAHDGLPDQVLVQDMQWRDGQVVFALLWRTPEGEVHGGALRVTPRPEHRQLLAKVGRGLAFVPELVGCVALDTALLVAAIPIVIIMAPKLGTHP